MPFTNGPQPTSGTLLVGDEPGSAVLLPSAARTVTNSIYFSPGPNRKIVTVTLKTTAYTSGGNTPSIEYYDPASDTWIALLTGAKVVATGTAQLSVGPNAPVTANVSAQCSLAPQMRFTNTVDDATSITYSVGIRAT